MPDNRFLHRCQGHSEKLSGLTHLEYRVWTQYLLSADDYGVMPDSASIIRGDNFALEAEPEETIAAAMETLKRIGLVQTFTHQGRRYLWSASWQNYQSIRFPRSTHYPIPSAEVLQKCSGETSALFQKHSPGLTPSQVPVNHRLMANGLRLMANGLEGSGEGQSVPASTGSAWEDWREEWAANPKRRVLPLTPPNVDMPKFADAARRFPDDTVRRRLMHEYFTTANKQITKTPYCIGMFLHWADKLAEELTAAATEDAKTKDWLAQP
jgi:hypothetical protein